MSVSISSSIGRLLTLVAQIIFTVGFAILAWAFWGLYQQERSSNVFAKEGQLITVRVTEFSTAKQLWTDYLGNVKYIGFNYNGKKYTARYVQDTLFVSEGTLVPLLYHPQPDAFRQPSKQFRMKENNNNKSRLIKWSVISLFGSEQRWLILCLMISVVFFLLLTGLLSQVPGLSYIQNIAKLVFTLLLFAGAVYLTYEAFAYYRYYGHIKTTGQKLQVTVISKYKTCFLRTDEDMGYSYSATVTFQNKEREIPIEENDYNQAEKGSKLAVYYASYTNDMMAVDYTMDSFVFIFPVIVWLILSWVSE